MPKWIDLEGTANTRDVTGISTPDGPVRPNALIRSDNLQGLSADDITTLSDLGVTDVVDLRSLAEVVQWGDGPLATLDAVTIHHFDLYPTPGPEVDLRTAQMPWIGGPDEHPEDAGHAERLAGAYLSYFARRPDSVMGAMRTIAHSQGATVVHCAAGKDRTGTIVASALLAVGADVEEVVADYEKSNERLDAIGLKLHGSPTGATMNHMPQTTPAETLRHVLAALDDRFGGIKGWLVAQGWTDHDQKALERKLIG